MVNAKKIPIRGCNMSVVLLGMFSNLKNHKNGSRRMVWNKTKPPYEENNLETTHAIHEGRNN